MTTKEIHDGIAHNIKWHATGEIIDRIDAYDWDEIVKGECQYGILWVGYARISLGEIITVEEPRIL